MSIALSELQLTADWVERFGRKDAYYGDTLKADGSPLDAARGKPMVMYAQWSPPAAQGTDLVDELHITYTDGGVVKVPAEEFRVAK